MTAQGFVGGDPTKLSLTGGTMTGPITLPGNPALNFGPDVDLYRIAADVLATDGKLAVGLDVETVDSAHGLVMHDRVNGHVYRLKITSGVLALEQIS